MKTYLRTIDLDIERNHEHEYQTKAEIDVYDEDVEFAFRFYVEKGQIITGAIDWIKSDEYEQEVITWYKSNRGFLRNSIKKTLAEEGMVDEETIADSL